MWLRYSRSMFWPIAIFFKLLWELYNYWERRRGGVIEPVNPDPRPTPYLIGVGGTNNTLNPRYIEWCLRNCVELPNPRDYYDDGYDGFL